MTPVIGVPQPKQHAMHFMPLPRLSPESAGIVVSARVRWGDGLSRARARVADTASARDVWDANGIVWARLAPRHGE